MDDTKISVSLDSIVITIWITSDSTRFKSMLKDFLKQKLLEKLKEQRLDLEVSKVNLKVDNEKQTHMISETYRVPIST